MTLRAVSTPLGPIVVLPPCGHCADIERRCGRPSRWCDRPAVGDSVDVEVECPTCGGIGRTHGLYGYGVDCKTCKRSGTVSVPHVVREVLPCLAGPHATDDIPDHFCVHPDSTVMLVREGIEYLIDLPDAQPGGVALLVAPVEAS